MKRYPDQLSVANACRKAMSFPPRSFIVAMLMMFGCLVLMAFVMSPEHSFLHSVVIIGKLWLVVTLITIPLIYIGEVWQIYYRDTPMMVEERQRWMRTLLNDKYRDEDMGAES